MKNTPQPPATQDIKATKLWEPVAEDLHHSQLALFIKHINAKYNENITNFHDMHAWTLTQSAEFWRECAAFFNVPWQTPPGKKTIVLHNHLTATRWFPGSKLNYSEALLQRRDDANAIISLSESGNVHKLSFAALYKEVKAFHYFFKACGIKKGDVIAAYLPNSSETIVSFLAAASLGAIWTSCSPDFGVQAVTQRFQQVKPKALIICNAYTYKGKQHYMQDKIELLLQSLASVAHVLEVTYLAAAPILKKLGDQQKNPPVKWHYYHETNLKWQQKSAHHLITFVPLPFDHPLYILYSSGTTGSPKCIVHRTGGVLLKHLSELGLHLDLKYNERLFFFTTCGWMMWNWMVSALALGTTLILYDGSPFYPSLTRLLEEVATHQVTVFGAGSAYYAHLHKNNLSHAMLHERNLTFTTVRTATATGAPVTEELFNYLYQTLTPSNLSPHARRPHIISMSGGTDIVGDFVMGTLLLPVYSGQIQAPTLGTDIRIVNAHLKPTTTAKGELTCWNPIPSMPLAFYHDDAHKSKYKQAYFHTLDNIWFQGDYAKITPQKGIIIYGRSDNTLNTKGVRIGTAEIYKPLETIDVILSAAAVTWNPSHQQENHLDHLDSDTLIVLFVVLKPHNPLTPQLQELIRTKLRSDASPRHVPEIIIAAPDLPRTINAKISEKAVKDALHHRTSSNLYALANPESLPFFRNLNLTPPT